MEMLIRNICKNMKILKKIKNMIRGIHYFSAEVKMKIDVIPRGCFNIILVLGYCAYQWRSSADNER